MANGVVEPEIVSKNGDRGGKPEGAALDCSRRTCGDVGVVATASPARGIRHQRNQQGLALAALAVVGGCNREAAVRGICGEGQAYRSRPTAVQNALRWERSRSSSQKTRSSQKEP